MKSLPFVLGTDIIHIVRLDPIRKSAKFVSLARRILHPAEFTSAISRQFKEASSHRSVYQWLKFTLPHNFEQEVTDRGLSATYRQSADKAATWLAGRFAAKEAAKKAWGASMLSWKDVRVEIDDSDDNAPFIGGTSKPVKIVCQPYFDRDYGFGESKYELDLQQEGRLSISHDGEYCVATVIAEPLNAELLSVFQKRELAMNAKENGWRRIEGFRADAIESESLGMK